MRGGQLYIILIFILLMATLCSAEAGLALKTLDKDITLSEVASYELTVTNTDISSQTFTIYGLEVLWSVDPAQRAFVLHPGQSKKVLINVKPLGPFKPSTYSLKLYIDVTSAGGEGSIDRLERDLEITLYPDKPVNYLPAINVDVDMVETIDPNKAFSIKLFLENGNPLDLSGLTVKIQSDMPEFQKEVSLDLPPLGKKTAEFTITPNKFQQPKEYLIFIVFEKGGEQIKVVEKRIEFLEVIPEFSVQIGQENIFLKKFWRVNILNDGNVLNTQEAKVPISWVGSVLTSGVDFKTIDGKRYAVWEVTLQPGERKVIPVITNYRLLLYLLAVLVFLAVFYLVVQSPIVLEKRAVTTKTDEEGALSEIKVTLEIRNKSNKVLNNLEVVDIIPGIANLEKSIELGTLKPQQIKHTKKGTKVIWSLAEVEPKEHRLITYKVKAKLNILGAISLPRAVVEFTKGKKKSKAHSNMFKLG